MVDQHNVAKAILVYIYIYILDVTSYIHITTHRSHITHVLLCMYVKLINSMRLKKIKKIKMTTQLDQEAAELII